MRTELAIGWDARPIAGVGGYNTKVPKIFWPTLGTMGLTVLAHYEISILEMQS